MVRSSVRKDPRGIVEYGCGIGRNLRFLGASFPDAVICGCDPPGRGLERAAKNMEADHLTIKTGLGG